MPVDYANPLVIKFLLENYEKEQERRMAWFSKHQDKITKAATLPKKYKDYRTEDIRRALIEPCMEDLKAHHIATFDNRLKTTMRNEPIVGITGMAKDVKLVAITNMKPVEPEVRNILYESIPYGGRRIYLEARNRKSPEERYEIFETSNHLIGWRLKDSENTSKTQGPKFGIYSTFAHDVPSRSGPQPDPHHYTPAQKDVYSKCNQ